MSTNRPDLTEANQDLAQDNVRVDSSVDELLGRIDSLLEATVNKDWDQVQSQSKELASGGLAAGLTEIAESARRVCEALEDRSNANEFNESMSHLVSRCKAARKPDRDTPSK